MQETCQGPKEAVVMVDGVSISITVDATIKKRDGEHSPDTEKSSRHHTWQSTGMNGQDSTGTVQTNAHTKEGLTSHADTQRASYRQLAPPPLIEQ